jgi:hypothetical protein
MNMNIITGTKKNKIKGKTNFALRDSSLAWMLVM